MQVRPTRSRPTQFRHDDIAHQEIDSAGVLLGEVQSVLGRKSVKDEGAGRAQEFANGVDQGRLVVNQQNRVGITRRLFRSGTATSASG